MNQMLEIIKRLPLGYSEVLYGNKKYGTTHTMFNQGKSHKVFAEELGGVDFISLNLYLTHKGEQIKPCEMPMGKVIDFLTRFALINNSSTKNQEWIK